MLSVKIYRIKCRNNESNKVGSTLYCDCTKEEIENTLLKDGWKKYSPGYIKNGFYLSVKEITPVKDLPASLSFI